MNWPVSEWVELRCSSCGDVIPLTPWSDGTNDTYQEAEMDAARIQGKHKCAPSNIQLQSAREHMKELRQTQKMTFEEECKVYNEILLNPTYLTQ